MHRNLPRDDYFRSRLALVLAFLSVIGSGGMMAQYRVIGYYPMWLRTALPAGQVKFDLLTHVNHAFAWPNPDGTLASYDATVDTGLINAAHRAGRKILLSLGGAAESGAFPRVAADSTLRAAFVSNIISHLTLHGYDGVDLDWEGPSNLTEKSNEVLLVQDLRAGLEQTGLGLLLTMAVGVSDWSGRWHDFAALRQYVDWFNAMTYDFHGSWSAHAGHNAPLYAPQTEYDGCVDQGIAYLHQTRGIPASQIVLGVPFYGKRFRAADLYQPQSGETDILYADAVYDQGRSWLRVWDAVSLVPYLKAPSNTQIDTFDDSLSLAYKCEYAKSKSLSGVMIWALGEDLLSGNQPLMEAVGQAMRGAAGIQDKSVALRGNSFELLNNYPNPFNPSTQIEYSLDRPGKVDLKVYSVTGQVVKTLLNGIDQQRGSYRVDVNMSGYASGVYFYVLQQGANRLVKPMVLMK